jgi:hypothetical protein
LDIWTSCITIWHQIMVKVMFTSLPVLFFREFIFKTNLMRNQEKPFRIWNTLSLVRAQAQLHKKMLTLNVTNRIIMKITVWLIPTRQRFDNCLLKKFNYNWNWTQRFFIIKHSCSLNNEENINFSGLNTFCRFKAITYSMSPDWVYKREKNFSPYRLEM